jgi:hypothetical protein
MFVACDESGVKPKDKYLIIGSAWVTKQGLCDFEKNTTALRLKNKCWGEIKWDKVGTMSDQMLKLYKNFIDLAFDNIPVYFRFIVIEKKLVKIKEYHQNNWDLARLKFLNFLISRYAEKFFDKETQKGLHVIFDHFEQSKRAKKENWESETRKYIEKYLGDTIEHLSPCTSHICSLVQLSDLFTGAIATSWNLPNDERSAQKNELIHYMEAKTKHKFNFSTLLTEKEFNLWVWRPSIFMRVPF